MQYHSGTEGEKVEHRLDCSVQQSQVYNTLLQEITKEVLNITRKVESPIV